MKASRFLGLIIVLTLLITLSQTLVRDSGTGLAAGTAFTVNAYDAVGNESGQGRRVLGMEAMAANYPLEIINIKPAGTGSPAISPNNRIFKAYPGLTYDIRVAVYGGTYPLTYTLSNEPSGMTIDTDTGAITWSNPQSDSGTITVTVTDAEESVDEATWNITVTTDGFYFVDSSVADGGNGSINNPWNEWTDFYLGRLDSTYNNAMVYFKNGTYTYPSAYTSGTAGSSNRLHIIDHPKVFLAYPDHNAVYFDGERSGNRIHLYTTESNIYFDSINFVHGYGFNIESQGGNYFCAIDCSFDDLNGSGSSSNQAAISFRADAPNDENEPPVSDAGFKLYPVIQNCIFTNSYDNEAGIEDYGTRYGVFSDNHFENLATYGINFKSTNDKTIVRNNIFKDTRGIGILAQYYAHNIDISFNHFDNSNIQVGNYAGTAGPGPTHIYRNTIVGTLFFRNIDSGDGPIYISNNVIINSDPADHIRDEIGEHYSITANMAVLSDNLLGYPADNIVDSDGNLTEAYSSYLGTHGHQVVYDEDAQIYFEFDGESGYQYMSTPHPGGGSFSYMGGSVVGSPGILPDPCSNRDTNVYHYTVLSDDLTGQGAVPGSQHSLKTPYAGHCNGESFSRDTTIITIPDGVTEAYIRWYQKFTGDWNDASVQHKFTKFYAAGVSGRGAHFSFAPYSNEWRNFMDNIGGQFNVGITRGPNGIWIYETEAGAGSQYDGVARYWDNYDNGIDAGADGQFQFQTDVWYCIELHFKLNSASDTADGLTEAWVDGTKVFGMSNIRFWGDSPVVNQYTVNTFEFQHIYYNRGSNNQPTYMDNIVIADSYIGPISGTTPTRSNGAPTGELSAGTTSTTISLTTNESATCRYSTTPNTAYASMPNTFSTTGTTSHSTTVSGLENGGSYTYYVRCEDAASNANPDDYPITFSIAESLVLHGLPADQTIHLSWQVGTTLPVTSTWQIAYDGPTGDQPSPITDIVSPTRAYTLTGLTNYTWYTVTLNAMSGSTPLLTDTVRVMPSDIFVYLPLVLKGP